MYGTFVVTLMRTAALWSSIRPPWTRIISEKKSSSGTVAPALFVLALMHPRRLLFGNSPCSTSCVTFGRGNSDRCSSKREPWHLISISRNASSGAGSFVVVAVLVPRGLATVGWRLIGTAAIFRRWWRFCGDGTSPGNCARCSSIRSDCKSAIISSKAFWFPFVGVGVAVWIDDMAGKLFCWTSGLRTFSRPYCEWEWPIVLSEQRWSSMRLLWVRVNRSKKSSSFGLFAAVRLVGVALGTLALFSFGELLSGLLWAALIRLPSGVNWNGIKDEN